MVNAPQEIRVHGTQYLIERLNAEDNLLIVDDVFSTGYNVNAVIQRLESKLKLNMPEQVRIATLYRRPRLNRTNLSPDFYLYETNDWLVFPYELKGLSREEIEQFKPSLAPLMHFP